MVGNINKYLKETAEVAHMLGSVGNMLFLSHTKEEIPGKAELLAHVKGTCGQTMWQLSSQKPNSEGDPFPRR